MKKILLLVALIVGGYYIYSDFLSPSDKNITRTGHALRLKNLFDKVSSTPVSAQEARPVFKESVINACETMARIDENVSGTAAECINNFERLASEQCFNKLVDFESKVYTSFSTLKADLLAYHACTGAIVSSATW